MPQETRFTKEALAAYFGVTPRNIKHWRAAGIVPAPHGHGRWAYYSDLHVQAIRQLRIHVYDHNVTLAEYAERLREPEAELDVVTATGV
jgi:DNA-binding transcriptional MerR regulator